MTRRLAELALLAYPLAFRRRYGAELRALLDDSPPRPGTVFDVLRGAVAAHLRPPAGIDAGVVGPDDRLRASISGVLACWLAFAVAGIAFAITTEDAPFVAAGSSHPLLGDVHHAIQLLAIVASLALAAGAAPLVVGALARARRDSGLRLLVSLPVAALAAFAALTGALAAVAHAGHSAHATTGSGLAFFAWVLAGLVCAVVCLIASRRVLFLIAVAPRVLVIGFRCATIVTAAMIAMAVSTVLYAFALPIDSPGLAAAPNGPWHPTSVAVAVILQAAVMVVAAAAAATTVRRGRRAVPAIAA